MERAIIRSVTAITLPTSLPQTGALRPLNILHDLPQVADLIELCFESNLDDDGWSYVQQMRRASRDSEFLRWASRMMESSSMPLSGFVWEESGKIIGNTSLVFQSYHGRKIGMLANVATHPEHRRRGIGHALTEHAMAGAREKGVQELWLQVRYDNPSAIKMYTTLGFSERARRTTYRSRNTARASTESGLDGAAEGKDGARIKITRPNMRDWPMQHGWLRRSHPEELGWYAHWDWNMLGPGWRNSVMRIFTQIQTRQWAAYSDGRLLGTLSWIPNLRVANTLWIASPPDHNGAALRLMLRASLTALSRQRQLSIEHPAGDMEETIQSTGFEAVRTLVWMRAPAT